MVEWYFPLHCFEAKFLRSFVTKPETKWLRMSSFQRVRESECEWYVNMDTSLAVTWVLHDFNAV